MSAVLIVPALAEHAQRLGPRLRPADAAELGAMGVDPTAALVGAVAVSFEAWTGLVDGEPAAMWGASAESLLADRAALWFLTGPAAARYPRLMVRTARAFVARLQETFPTLVAMVDGRYAGACRLVEILGFERGEDMGGPFYRVRRVRHGH